MGKPEQNSIIDRLLAAVPCRVAGWLGLDYPRLSPWQRTLFQICVIACLLNMGASVHDFFRFGGTDLRVRVVGARALLAGLDPYTLADSPELPPTLRDPHQTHLGLSRCTYPPTLLLMYAIFSPLPYLVQRGLWMILEWLALFGVLALLTRVMRVQGARYVFAVFGLGLVATSNFWRMHVERGQYYVFVELLLAAGVYLALKQRRDGIGAGVLFGLAVALRPTTVLLCLPLGLAGRWRMALAAGVTALLVVLSTLPFAGLSGWRHFTRLADEWEHVVTDPTYASHAYPTQPEADDIIDGFRPATLRAFSANVSLAPAFYLVAGKTLPASAHFSPSVLLRLSLLVLVGTILAVFWARQRRPFTMRQALAVGMLLAVLSDYFLPIRVSYADVLFCIPIALVMPALCRSSNRAYLLVLATAFLVSLVPIGDVFDSSHWVVVNLARSVAVLYVCARPLLVRSTASNPVALNIGSPFVAVHFGTGQVDPQSVAGLPRSGSKCCESRAEITSPEGL